MLANKLEVTVYPNAGRSWHTEAINQPTWEQIENAIRDLDRAEHPFLQLYLPDGEGESGLSWLDVIGGAGEYGISATCEDLQERWRAAGQGGRGAIIRDVLRDATRREHALLVRALALGAVLDLSCDALLFLLGNKEGNSAH